MKTCNKSFKRREMKIRRNYLFTLTSSPMQTWGFHKSYLTLLTNSLTVAS